MVNIIYSKEMQQASYRFSLLQKSYHSNIWKVIPSLHGKHTPPDDKETAASIKQAH
jgi:hypothetical protein